MKSTSQFLTEKNSEFQTSSEKYKTFIKTVSLLRPIYNCLLIFIHKPIAHIQYLAHTI